MLIDFEFNLATWLFRPPGLTAPRRTHKLQRGSGTASRASTTCSLALYFHQWLRSYAQSSMLLKGKGQKFGKMWALIWYCRTQTSSKISYQSTCKTKTKKTFFVITTDLKYFWWEIPDTTWKIEKRFGNCFDRVMLWKCCIILNIFMSFLKSSGYLVDWSRLRDH